MKSILLILGCIILGFTLTSSAICLILKIDPLWLKIVDVALAASYIIILIIFMLKEKNNADTIK